VIWLREKRTDVADICLDVFIKYGLSKTTNRIICRECKMAQGNFYTYFPSKDDMIIACAKSAAGRISDKVIIPTIKEMFADNPNISLVIKKARKMMPTMHFLLQVYTEEKYTKSLTQCVQAESENYREYANRMAKEKGVNGEDENYYISMLITAITNFMIFGDETFLRPLLENIKICAK